MRLETAFKTCTQVFGKMFVRTKGSGRFSLKRRLVLGILGAVTLIWLLTALVSFLDARSEINKLLDAHLAQSASLLLVQSSSLLEQDDDDDDDEILEQFDDIDTEHVPLQHRYSRQVVFQIWWRGRRLLLHSVHAPNQRLAKREEGFSDSDFAGERWRVFSSWDDSGRLLIQIGERRAARDKIAHEIGEHLLQPVLFALVVLAAIIWFSIGRGLRPLTTLSGQVAQRDPANLAPLAATNAPSEVMPLVYSLNRLLARVSESLESERRFTADAAHELRTPLAALRAQAQVALGAADDIQRQHALQQVIVGCDRAAHLVEQLLTLARLEPAQPTASWCSFDLHALAASVIGDLAPQAWASQIELELEPGSALNIRGEPALLRVLLRNLIDNAIRYSPQDSTVSIAVGLLAGRPTLSVSDQGPGLTAQEQARVWQRFYRVLGNSAPGSGLGLSIVKRIAEIHAATIDLGPAAQGRGLRVTVSFPAPNAT